MTTDDDDDLRQAFAALRHQDVEAAPAYADVLARGRVGADGRGRLAVLGRALAAAALAAALATGLLMRRAPEPAPALASLGAWTAPTDFLLQTPGSEILDSVPRFGSPPQLLTRAALAPDPEPNRRSPSP